MSKKEKTQAELDAEAKAKADAEADEQDEESDENEDESDEDEDSDEDDDSKDKNLEKKIDYKSIADKEKDRADKATKAAADLAFKLRQKNRKKDEDDEDSEDEDEEDDAEDKPLTSKDLKEIENRIEKRLQAPQIKKIAQAIAESEDEAEAIIAIHNNRSFPSDLTLEEQLEECHAIANRKVFKSKNAELARSLKNKDGISRDNTTTHRDPMDNGTAPKLPKSEIEAYKRAGFKYDSKDRVFKKPLTGGKKFLYKDPKTKRTWIQ